MGSLILPEKLQAKLPAPGPALTTARGPGTRIQAPASRQEDGNPPRTRCLSRLCLHPPGGPPARALEDPKPSWWLAWEAWRGLQLPSPGLRPTELCWGGWGVTAPPCHWLGPLLEFLLHHPPFCLHCKDDVLLLPKQAAPACPGHCSTPPPPGSPPQTSPRQECPAWGSHTRLTQRCLPCALRGHRSATSHARQCDP